MAFSPEIVDSLLRMPVGDRTDRFLYLILEPWFMGYWTYARPRDKGIELADVLVIYGDTVLLFEAKTRETGQAEQPWIRGRLLEAARSINDRAERLRKGQVEEIKNTWRGILRWDPASIKHYYGVIILNHICEPYEPREVAKEAFANSEVPLQVFSLADLDQLLRFVNTIYDFIVYYELRARFAEEHRVLVHDEQVTYTWILERMPDLLPPEFARGPMIQAQQFQKAVTRAVLRSEGARKRDFERLAASYLLDTAAGSLIEKVRRDIRGRPIEDAENKLMIDGISAIMEMSRLRRSVWGQRWLSVAESARKNNTSRHTMGRSPMRNRAYVFCATTLQDDVRGELLSGLVTRAFTKLDSTSVLCLAASPRRIAWTYNWLRSLIRRRDNQALAADRILDATLAWSESSGS